MVLHIHSQYEHQIDKIQHSCDSQQYDDEKVEVLMYFVLRELLGEQDEVVEVLLVIIIELQIFLDELQLLDNDLYDDMVQTNIILDEVDEQVDLE
jgi:hypothetical protein